jgi:hypothetical protein
MTLFFIRRYNDIDHIVPIIYKACLSGNLNTRVLCLDHKIDFKSDFRIKFLINEFNLYVEYAGKYFWPKKFLDRSKFFFKYGIFYNNAISNKITFISHDNKILIKIIKEKLIANEISTLIFDWQKHQKIFLSSAILAAVNDLGLKTIAVPHGINLMENLDLIEDKNLNSKSPNWGGFMNIFETIVVPHLKSRELFIKDGVDPDKIQVIGSTRFCSEWRKVYSKILPISNLEIKNKGNEGKLKVLFMDHNTHFRIDGDLVNQAMVSISKCDDFNLIIKPSTGSKFNSDHGVSSSLLKKVAKLDYKTHSNELIDWCDVVIATTTSMVIEALLQNKIFLYPKYFHKNKMIWESQGACYQVNNTKELLNALVSIKENKISNKYNANNVSGFINNVVYGGLAKRDVLKDYVDLIR